MTTIELPIRDSKKPRRLKFPDRCVNCGEPKAKTLPVNLWNCIYSGLAALTARNFTTDIRISLCVGCIRWYDCRHHPWHFGRIRDENVFARTYGTLLVNRPLTVLSIFNDSENIIGLSTRFTDGRKTLKLNFENDEIAREFAALNSQENG